MFTRQSSFNFVVFLILFLNLLWGQEKTEGTSTRYITSKIPIKSTYAEDSTCWYLEIKSDVNGDSQIETVSIGWSHGFWVIDVAIYDSTLGVTRRKSIGTTEDIFDEPDISSETHPAELAVVDITNDGVDDIIAVFKHQDFNYGYYIAICTYNKLEKKFKTFPFNANMEIEIPKKGVLKLVSGGNQAFEEFHLWDGKKFVLYEEK